MRVFALFALILSAWPASALDRTTHLSQFMHRAWTTLDIAPDTVTAFAQTSDGRFWLASDAGLWGFDGIRFSQRATNERGAPSWSISTASSLPENSLWLGFDSGGVALYTDEKLTVFDASNGLPEGSVRGIVRDGQGVTWAATEGGLARLMGARWRTFGTDFELDSANVLAILNDSSDRLWVATPTSIARIDSSRTRSELIAQFPASAAPKFFAEGADGDVWLTGEKLGVIRFDNESGRMTRWFSTKTFGQMLFDRDGALWIAGDGLSRFVPGERGLAVDEQEANRRLERFAAADGLTNDNVLRVFEDREGNIWVATRGGLDRFTRSPIVHLEVPPTLANWGNLVLVADGDVLWVAAHGGPALLRYKAGELVERRNAPIFTAGTRAADGSVWFGGPAGIARVDGDEMKLLPLPAAAAGNDIATMVHDGHGRLWISVRGKGLFRWDQRGWVPFGGLDALPRQSALSSARSDDGTVWLGYSTNLLAWLKDDDVKVFDARNNLAVGAVTALSASGGILWIGGDQGLARFDGRTFMRLKARNCQAFAGISGAVAGGAAELWVFRSSGLSRIENRWKAAANDAGEQRAACSTNRQASGLKNSAQQWPRPSLVRTSDGIFWLATVGGLARGDPAQLQNLLAAVPDEKSIAIAPKGIIEFVRGRTVDDSVIFYPNDNSSKASARTFPPHTKDLFISYTSTGLTAPDRVRFRSRLLGYDDQWQPGLTAHEAVYTNLGPGTYRLELTASADGVNFQKTPASFDFEILPAFYQTTWFKALCAVSALIALVFLYRLQLARASRRVRERLEERTLERERIARDLHDTLLQGVQALILRVHSASRRIAPHEPARLLIDEALEQAEEVLVEGRDRVTDLRAVTDDTHLSQGIAATGHSVSRDSNVAFKSSVLGLERRIHPIVREETYLIAREALVNAAKHAGAKAIEATIAYERIGLRITIEDDGIGMGAEILAKGRQGHWGLQGMRERAARINADLKITGRPGGGTCVSLRIPPAIAFRPATEQLPTERRAGLTPLKKAQ